MESFDQVKYLQNSTEKSTLNLAGNHYENFPVASFLLPRKMREHVAVIYWFARTADDIADEGNYSSGERLSALEKFESELTSALEGNSSHRYFSLLKKTIDKKSITTKYFYDLLSAFKQDIVKKRYQNFSELLDYCSRSANPVGRIILELNGIRDETAAELSDRICTALQLVNFYQDTAIDFEKGRIYYPLDEMKIFGVSENMFELKRNNPHISALIKHSIDRTGKLFDEGRNLTAYLEGKFKLEIKWTISGGEKILDKIRCSSFDVFSERPKLNKFEYFILLFRSII